MYKGLIGILLCLLLGFAPAFGQLTDDKCVIGAWVYDRELYKDTSIRDLPEWMAKSIGEVPAALDSGQETMIGITGSKDGWLRIQRAVSMNDDVLFEGVGWLRWKRVLAMTYSADGKRVALYRSASAKSARTSMLAAGTEVEVLAHSCFGLRVRAGRRTGWLRKENICANPLTKCGAAK